MQPAAHRQVALERRPVHGVAAPVVDLRVRSHCRLRNTGTEYVNESAVKRMGGSTKQQCDRAPVVHLPPVRAAVLEQAADGEPARAVLDPKLNSGEPSRGEGTAVYSVNRLRSEQVIEQPLPKINPIENPTVNHISTP